MTRRVPQVDMMMLTMLLPLLLACRSPQRERKATRFATSPWAAVLTGVFQARIPNVPKRTVVMTPSTGKSHTSVRLARLFSSTGLVATCVVAMSWWWISIWSIMRVLVQWLSNNKLEIGRNRSWSTELFYGCVMIYCERPPFLAFVLMEGCASCRLLRTYCIASRYVDRHSAVETPVYASFAWWDHEHDRCRCWDCNKLVDKTWIALRCRVEVSRTRGPHFYSWSSHLRTVGGGSENSISPSIDGLDNKGIKNCFIVTTIFVGTISIMCSSLEKSRYHSAVSVVRHRSDGRKRVARVCSPIEAAAINSFIRSVLLWYPELNGCSLGGLRCFESRCKYTVQSSNCWTPT